MSPFDYPEPRVRRHGPRGYADYTSYRPWLRDEFAFRCVFCLAREQWERVAGTFAIDHFLPVSSHPRQRKSYSNLLYTCNACNEAKLDQIVPDPLRVLTRETVVVKADGHITGFTAEAREAIRVLALDDVETVRWRSQWIEMIDLARERRPALFRCLMAYPDDMPALAALRPPGGNARPGGVAQSHHARRARGELPAVY